MCAYEYRCFQRSGEGAGSLELCDTDACEYGIRVVIEFRSSARAVHSS